MDIKFWADEVVRLYFEGYSFEATLKEVQNGRSKMD